MSDLMISDRAMLAGGGPDAWLVIIHSPEPGLPARDPAQRLISDEAALAHGEAC
jgi:hypothetical protein